MEEWRDIPGYEGLYQVSNLGRIKSFCRGKKKILKTRKSKTGYFYVNLYKPGKRKTLNIHRLVAMAFIPNPYNKPEVNHKDGNKENNCVQNLEWVSTSENQRHSINVLHRKNPKWRGGVNIFTKEGKFITRVEDSKAAAEWVKENTDRERVSISGIKNTCNGKRRSNFGFIFRYVKEKKLITS